MALPGFGVGFMVGFGSGLIARDTLPVIKTIFRPFTRFAMKSTVKVFERSREAMARASEALEDTVAEVKTELKGRTEKKTKKRKHANVVELKTAKRSA